MTIGECPFVQHYGNGVNTLFATQPSQDGLADPSDVSSDGYFDIYWAPWEVGLLLVAVVATTEDGALAAPAGWTELANETWGDIPYSTGVNPGYTPFTKPHANIAVFYRIADGTEGDTDAIAFTITGLTYMTNGNPPYSVGGGQMFTFAAIEQGSFSHVAFPDPPIKYAGMDSVDPRLLADETEAASHVTANEATFPTAVADYVGNHMYLQVAQIKGWSWEIETAEDGQPTYPSYVVSPTGFDDFSGGHGPFPFEGSQFGVFANAEDIFSTGALPMTDSYAPGTVRTYASPSGWNDGFLGTLHVDFEDWAVLFGIAALSFVIQAPLSDDCVEVQAYWGILASAM